MKAKVQERARAIELRRAGHTYNEILDEVDVAKSTLSGWLKDLPLTDNEKEYLKQRTDKNISRGRIKAAAALRNNRLKREQKYAREAQVEFQKWKDDPFFCIGVALYWAEGSKRSTNFSFTNSDHLMTRTFIQWIEEFTGIPRSDLRYRLYIHKHYANEDCEQFWADQLGIDVKDFQRTTYKPSRKLVKKRPQYKGCLRVTVPKGKKLLCKMKVWQNMVADMRP